jgi:hypothetical protein
MYEVLKNSSHNTYYEKNPVREHKLFSGTTLVSVISTPFPWIPLKLHSNSTPTPLQLHSNSTPWSENGVEFQKLNRVGVEVEFEII